MTCQGQKSLESRQATIEYLQEKLALLLSKRYQAQSEQLKAIQGQLFDEAELAVAQVQPAITRWTAAADELTILSSSRRSLGVSGERVLAIEPLGPEVAVQLFVMRARTQRADWDPRQEERAAIRELVVALDCLPLAESTGHQL